MLTPSNDESTAAYQAEMAKAMSLHMQRGEEYDNVEPWEYWTGGLADFEVMIRQKSVRLKSIISNAKTELERAQAVEDTLSDLINYAAMAAAWARMVRMDADATRKQPVVTAPDMRGLKVEVVAAASGNGNNHK